MSTGGELAVALRAGFPPERLVFHGNNKSVAEIARGLDAGVGRFVLDSFEEIARIAYLAAERGWLIWALVSSLMWDSYSACFE